MVANCPSELPLGGCEASAVYQKGLEVCGHLVSFIPTKSVSQAASHGVKGNKGSGREMGR